MGTGVLSGAPIGGHIGAGVGLATGDLIRDAGERVRD